jgi:hypothetical protein
MADDRRDERLAELLDVEPLDELTRRRLVARALEESSPGRADPEPAETLRRGRWQPFAAAAAIVVVLVAGLVVLLGGDGSDPPEQALRPSRPAEVAPRDADSRAASPAPASRGASSSAGDVEVEGSGLGDFGDLSQPANRVRAVEAALADRLAGSPRTDATGDTTAFAAASPAAAACSPVGATSVVAYGTGTFHDRPALVVVTRRDDGSARVRLVVGDPCEVRDLTG